MSKLLKFASGMAAAGSLLLAGQAHADPTAFLPDDALVQFKYNNLESVVEKPGDVLVGIANFSTIGDPDGTPYFASGISDGTILTGKFINLTVAQVTFVSPTSSIIYFIGGQLNIYNVPTGSYKPTSPTNPLDPQICFTSPGSICPTPFLTFDFVPGVVTVDNPTTPLFDERTAVLVSTVTGTVSPFSGTGDGQLEITGGTAAFKFVDGPGPDFSVQSNLQTCPAPVGSPFTGNCAKAAGYPIASFDPLIGRTSIPVPEPTSIALAGLALLGVCASTKRRAG